MKRLIVILLSLITFNISSAQTGWGYVNYTSYKTHNGTGATNQYWRFPNNAAEFDNMLNTTNSNTTITHTGETQIVNVYNGSWVVPRWNNDYHAIKFEFYFIPKETGTYTFSTTSDDASDLSLNGNVIIQDYGGHGAGNWKNAQVQMVAGTKYTMVGRYQEYGGGESFYIMWAKPSTPNTFFYYDDEVTNVGTIPSKQGRINFNFGSTLDKTKFTAAKPIGSNGWTDITNAIDSVKIDNGYRALTTAGQIEWCVIYDYDVTNQRYRIGIDSREVNGIINDPTKINSLKLFDLWDGPVTFNSYYSNGWTEVYVYTSTQFNFVGSSYISNIRTGNGYHALTAEFTFSPIQVYKPQSVTITTTNNLTTLYNSIVTVSDVWLAFKEVANIGIFGNQSGNEFGYGIQYDNGDVNDDGYFNETDSYLLLQHLIGKKPLVDTFNLRKTLKLISPTTYNTIGKSNWNTFPTFTGDTYNFDINTDKKIDTFYLSGTWKGDVNLSHSATPPSNGITTMSVRTMSLPISNEINASIVTELVGDSVNAYITIDPLQQELVGTQFELNYDNTLLKFSNISFKTKGSPTNYGIDKGDYINLGSLITDGGILDNTTEYKISFTSKTKLDNVLGLISVGLTDVVNKSGKTLKVIMK